MMSREIITHPHIIKLLYKLKEKKRVAPLLLPDTQIPISRF